MKKLIRMSAPAVCLGLLLSCSLGYLQAGMLLPGAVASWAPNITTTLNSNSAIYATTTGTGYDGVAALLIRRPSGEYLCTGTLLNSGRDVLTAGHCLSDALAVDVLSMDAYFFTPEGELETYAGAEYTLHPGYNPDLRTGNDVGVIRLARSVNSSIERYSLYKGSSEVGGAFDVAGFGARGTGAQGATIPAGTRIHGYNQFDATMAGTFSQLAGWTGGTNVLMSDFDSGLTANDAFGYFFGLAGIGLGDGESSPAGGDSGGPAFVNGQVAGIVSFGTRLVLSDGSGPDVDSFVNASFGEFAGFTRISSYRDFIDSAIGVPEPGTVWLLTGGLLLLVARRRRIVP